MKKSDKIQVSVVIIILALLIACSPFKQDEIVKHPDAPMLIIEGKGKVRVSIYYKDINKMIEYGWVDLKELNGWSIKKHDWEKFIQKKSKEK